MTSILFVCLGNICRSPLAEGIFIDLVEQAGAQDQYHIDSAGTGAYHIGKSADPRSIAVAKKHNIHLPSTARQINIGDFATFDIIIAMDSDNLRNIRYLSATPADEKKVYLMRQFDPQGPGNVPDPYLGAADGFDTVYTMLRRSCQGLFDAIEAGTV